MKIFSSTQLHELDKYTMEHEPVRSIDLMERAARAITNAITEEWSSQTPVQVFAGPGNNGGDALAVARLLAEQNYKVNVYLFNIHNKLSEDCEVNKQRVMESKRINKFTEINLNFDPPTLDADTLVIDGLFGCGISKPLSGGFAALVKYINQCPAKVVSIDLPSGLMPEDNSYNVKSNIVKADLTLTLQTKKLAMMLTDCQPYIGRLKVLDIRLSQEYIRKTNVIYKTLEESDVRHIIRHRSDFVNKGDMGHALLIAGSYGMAGASVLCAKACLRAGVGKVSVLIPKLNYTCMQVSVPEAVLHIDEDQHRFTEAIDTENYDAIGIGPGLGTSENTAIAMIAQIRRAQCPIVLDADALNILSNHRTWMQQLPKGIVMTPHPKEFDRLIGSHSQGCYERLMRARELAERQLAYIVLKDHYTALCLPSGDIIFNTTGNSGMATAGSGDVLTGIITALLARGYETQDACVLGMYLHGLAGDLAIKDTGVESLIASDIIGYLPQAFKRMGD